MSDPASTTKPRYLSKLAQELSDCLQGSASLDTCAEKGCTAVASPKWDCANCNLMFCEKHSSGNLCEYCSETHSAVCDPDPFVDMLVTDEDGKPEEELYDAGYDVDLQSAGHYYYPNEASLDLRVGSEMLSQLKVTQYHKLLLPQGVAEDESSEESEDRRIEKSGLAFEAMTCSENEDLYIKVMDQIKNSLARTPEFERRRQKIMRLNKAKAMINRRLKRAMVKAVETDEEHACE